MFELILAIFYLFILAWSLRLLFLIGSIMYWRNKGNPDKETVATASLKKLILGALWLKPEYQYTLKQKMDNPKAPEEITAAMDMQLGRVPMPRNVASRSLLISIILLCIILFFVGNIYVHGGTMDLSSLISIFSIILLCIVSVLVYKKNRENDHTIS